MQLFRVLSGAQVAGFSNTWKYLFALVLACCQYSQAADCASFGGAPASLAPDAASAVSKAVAGLRTGSGRGLLKAADGKLLLVRRSVASGPEGRVGNMRLPLHPTDFDAHMIIHVSGMTVPEFADITRFRGLSDSVAVALPHNLCDGEDHCEDGLPPSVDIPFMTKDLLQCNRGRDGARVFIFKDGLLVTDMHAEGDALPVGPALFIAKDAKGYRLAGLIVQHQ